MTDAAKLTAAILACSGALVSGGTLGLALGGVGICAVYLTPSLLGCSVAIAALFGGTVAFLWQRAWVAGALAFGLPMLLGAAFAVSGREWQRALGLGVTVAASFLAALVVRYPNPRRQ